MCREYSLLGSCRCRWVFGSDGAALYADTSAFVWSQPATLVRAHDVTDDESSEQSAYIASLGGTYSASIIPDSPSQSASNSTNDGTYCHQYASSDHGDALRGVERKEYQR